VIGKDLGVMSAVAGYTLNVDPDKGTAIPDFGSFSSSLIGLPVSRVWQGYGSAIFFEFGDVQPRRRRDGSPGNPRGQWTLMIEWSWRIEGKKKIWCGSWSDGERWPRAFSRLQGATVVSASLFGRLPEITLRLSNGLSVVSMMTAEGDPAWALIARDRGVVTSLCVLSGRLHMDADLADTTS
jgi:hypothetical protein